MSISEDFMKALVRSGLFLAFAALPEAHAEPLSFTEDFTTRTHQDVGATTAKMPP